MKSGTTTDEQRDSKWRANGISETLLRSEICFWTDMIAHCDPTQPTESLERMRYALALAESRLLSLLRDSPHEYTFHAMDEKPLNVYPITCPTGPSAPKPK